ncbi:hypothetical protein P692DRAFT_20836845, partial [Suillus brevipes Sb2]
APEVGQMHRDHANYSASLGRTRFFVPCTHIIMCDTSIVMLTWDWVKCHTIPTLVTSIFIGSHDQESVRLKC